MGCGKQRWARFKFAGTALKSGQHCGSRPHPIRPSATFPSQAGEGERPPFEGIDLLGRECASARKNRAMTHLARPRPFTLDELRAYLV